jgi:hypothetical protein
VYDRFHAPNVEVLDDLNAEFVGRSDGSVVEHAPG